jgi:hypothetical protein
MSHMSSLQNIVKSSLNAQVGGAETHRLAAKSNIENALCDDDFDADQTKALQRMVAMLDRAADDTPQRKLEAVERSIAILASMGLVKLID